MALPVLPWRNPHCFAELPAEMFRIIVTALYGDFRYAMRCVFQKVPGFENPEMNDIVHTGNVKFLPVEKL